MNGDQLVVVGLKQQDMRRTATLLTNCGWRPEDVFGGAAGILARLALLAAGEIAAYREPPLLSSGGVGRTAIYLISSVGALALGTISLFFLAIGVFGEDSIRIIDEEHRKGSPLK